MQSLNKAKAERVIITSKLLPTEGRLYKLTAYAWRKFPRWYYTVLYRPVPISVSLYRTDIAISYVLACTQLLLRTVLAIAVHISDHRDYIQTRCYTIKFTLDLQDSVGWFPSLHGQHQLRTKLKSLWCRVHGLVPFSIFAHTSLARAKILYRFWTACTSPCE